MRRIRRFLTPSVVKTIETSVMGSKLDYCNSVLFNVTDKEISKLQGVQNCLARVVTKSLRFCHITLLLKSLHWLPVRYRIKFKLCSLTYQAPTSGKPAYIRNMLQPSRKVRTLRSSDLEGGGPGVVVSTAALHARVRGSVLCVGGLKKKCSYPIHVYNSVLWEASVTER